MGCKSLRENCARLKLALRRIALRMEARIVSGSERRIISSNAPLGVSAFSL